MRMPDNAIALITGSDTMLGSGHLHRMASLLWFLVKKASIPAYMVLEEIPSFFPAELAPLVKSDIQPGTILLVRDKRNSTIKEISQLKKTAPVLVIDDCGQGSTIAEHRIDLLPTPEHRNNNLPARSQDFFIYGYGFIRSLINLMDNKEKSNHLFEKSIEQKFKKLHSVYKRNERPIDFALYPGMEPGDEYINSLTSLLPRNSTYAILQGENTTLTIGSEKNKSTANSYTPILISSKVFISHFGIALYEAHLSGCRLVTINPTDYHSRLSEMAKTDLNLMNSGEYSKLDRNHARQIISEAHSQSQTMIASPDVLYEKAIGNLKRFSDYILSIL